MTIIVYRDGIIAADTLVSSGGDERNPGHRLGYGPKLHRLDGGVFAYFGSGFASSAIHDWLSSGREGELPPVKDGGGVWFPDEGTIEDIGEHGVVPIDFDAPYFAWGAGDSYALGALWTGADAETAVRAAIALSLCCGGEIQVMRRGS